MTFLQLCQTLRQEAGIAGNGPVTTVGQTGELGRVVEWIKQAATEIYDKRIDWGFLRHDFSFNTVIGTSSYPRSTVANLAEWKRDSFRLYLNTVNDERWIQFVLWEQFRDTRLRGSSRTQVGRPIEFSIDPQKNVVCWPIPDNAYTIVGECFYSAPTLTNDSDTPVFDRFHMAIVYNGLMRYASWAEDPTTYARGQKDYLIQVGKLERAWNQEMRLGSALA